MPFFHGISAYSRKNISLQDRADIAASGNVEICASEVALGSIGLLVSGEVSGAFSHDCLSYIDDKDGRRYPSEEYEGESAPDHILNDQEELINWIKDVRDSKGPTERSYSEIFIKVQRVDAIWVKGYASPDQKRLAESLASRYGGCSVVVINDRHTYSWDALSGGSFDEWDEWDDIAA